MPETKSRFLKQIIGDGEEAEPRNFTEERQLTAQSFAFHVDYRDRLSGEGVTYSHLGRYHWKDFGSHESLRIIFGPLCALEILGHNLSVLMGKLREGQLKGVAEDLTSAVELAVSEGATAPVILSVLAYPDFDKLFEEIKAEARGDGKDAGQTRFTERLR